MDHEIYLQMREVEDRHWWSTARRHILQRVINSLSVPHQARVLDADCGTGGNLKLLSRFGQVSAMEMDDTARNPAQARNIADVRAGRLKVPTSLSNKLLETLFSSERFSVTRTRLPRGVSLLAVLKASVD